MATQNYAASVQGAALRVTRLNADGTLATGELDSYTTSAFLRMSFTPEYEDGEEITEKAADGTVCVSYKAPDRLKRATMELAICEPDPELTALLAGGILLTRNESTATPLAVSAAVIATGDVTLTVAASHGIVAGDNVTLTGLSPVTGTLNGIQRVKSVGATSIVIATLATGTVTVSTATITKRSDTSVGWAAPAIGDDPAGMGVAIEVWSHAVAGGKRSATNPYYARLRQSGDRVIENGLLANTFQGYGIGNTAFGVGPDARWEWTEVTDRPYAYARDDWSPSTSHLKGFYQWNATLDQNFTGAIGSYQAVANLPTSMVDTDFNVTGGFSYDATAPMDIAVSDV
jgi:hypothetical protein